MNLLVISGSTRRDSLNTRLARLVRDLRPADTVTIINDLNTLPFYDADLEEAAGFPPAVAALRERVAVADMVVAVTPEYNGTIPGVLGNAIDWLSRPPGGSVLDAKPTLVLSASPSNGHQRRVTDCALSARHGVEHTKIHQPLRTTRSKQR